MPHLSHRITSINGGGSDGWDVFYRARTMVAAGTQVTELTIGEHDIGDGGWDQRFEIPLGDAVKIGETNVLTVRVRDRGNYGGIWKSVKLVAAK